MSTEVAVKEPGKDVATASKAVATRKPGIYFNIDIEDYHSGPGVSKSGLWTIHKSTPAHYKYPPVVEKTTTSQGIADFGHATHTAVLEPEKFERLVYRGPEDRKGNKWTDAKEFCKLEGMTLLTQSQFDECQVIRDMVHANAFINNIITGGKTEVESSGYRIDPKTGVLVRWRPDFYREDIGIMLDVKTTESAQPEAFARSVVNFGYHAQEAHYTDGHVGLGRPVNGFLFLALEKKSPYAAALYELPPSIVQEGRVAMERATEVYAGCLKTDTWPAYPEGVQELAFKRWSYELTDAPIDGEE